MKKENGFTIIELSVAITIISILAAVAVPAYQGYVKKSQFAEVINMTGAIKTSNELCIKEYETLVGCSGGVNNVITDITATNDTKYTLSVVTQDGVITATARGQNDAAAIAAAGGATSTPTLPSGYYSSNGKKLSTFDQFMAPIANADISYPYLPGPMVGGFPTYNGFRYSWSGGVVVAITDLHTTMWGKDYFVSCPSGQSFDGTNCIQTPPAPASTPTTALNNETYILTPTIDPTSKAISYTVSGTCLAAGLCE